jgi:hypothetical protein
MNLSWANDGIGISLNDWGSGASRSATRRRFGQVGPGWTLVEGNNIEINSELEAIGTIGMYIRGDESSVEINDNIIDLASSIGDDDDDPLVYGLYIRDFEDSDIYVHENLISMDVPDAISVGIYLDDESYGGIFWDNTISSGSYSVYALNEEGTNQFYWNNFSAGDMEYAKVVGNNIFSTYIGGSDIGNYWGDIDSLDITDSNGDGYGDTGSDYPYNKANGARVSDNVVDYGPVVPGEDTQAPILEWAWGSINSTTGNSTIVEIMMNEMGKECILSVDDEDYSMQNYGVFWRKNLTNFVDGNYTIGVECMDLASFSASLPEAWWYANGSLGGGPSNEYDVFITVLEKNGEELERRDVEIRDDEDDEVCWGGTDSHGQIICADLPYLADGLYVA